MATKRVLEDRLRKRNKELEAARDDAASYKRIAEDVGERLNYRLDMANAQIGVLEDQVERAMQDVTKAHADKHKAEADSASTLRCYNALADEMNEIRTWNVELHTQCGQRTKAVEDLKREYLKLYYKSKSWTNNVLPFAAGMLFTAAIVIAGVFIGV